MKKPVMFSLALVFVAVTASQAATEKDVLTAAAKLGEASNYSWTNLWNGSPITEGVTEKDGYTITEGVSGTKPKHIFYAGRLLMWRKDKWLTASELQATLAKETEGSSKQVMISIPGGALIRSDSGPIKDSPVMSPATHAMEIAALIKDLKLPDSVDPMMGRLSNPAEDIFRGELTEAGAARALGAGITANKPSGSVKVWLANGVINKYQVVAKGTIGHLDDVRPFEIDMTTEIKNIGTTKVVVPDEVKKKFAALMAEGPAK